MNIISYTTIDRVKQVNIVDIISSYVSLKKSGSRHTACCPFHDEKSPSFSVSSSKQVFKCFGCGVSGDGITFVMKHERQEFIEAIKTIASKHSITIEYESLTDEESQQYELEQKEKQSLRILLTEAMAFFHGNNIPDEWLGKRAFDIKTLNIFKTGYAEGEKNKLFQAFTKQGWTPEQLVRAGLVREHKPEKGDPIYFDFFQDRVMFPIHDVRGNVVAFTGRLLNDQDKKADSKEFTPPKYSNSPDSVWTKGQNLFGLHLAVDEIKKKKFVYLVEGNPDVIRFHQVNLKNVVAPCGTALTGDQIKLLKKYTSRVTIVGDNDSPGRAAVHKNAQLLIENGIDVKVLMPTKPGSDPDDYIRIFKTTDELQNWLNSDLDYIAGHLLSECFDISEESAQDKTDQIKRMAAVIESIPDDILRSVYYDNVATIWKDFKKGHKLTKREQTTNLTSLDDEARKQIEEEYEYGFYVKDGCYYTNEKKTKVRICPFTIDVLFFVVSDNQPKYVCKFTHMFGRVAYKAVTTDDFTSVGAFKKVVERLKGFIFEGTQSHLDKIKIKLFYTVKEAYEPQHMGFNATGKFYTWANGVFYNKQFIKSDKYGIVNLQKPISTVETFKKLPPESRILVGEKEYTVPTVDKFIEKFTEPALERVIEKGMVFYQSYYYLPFSSSLKLTEDSDDDYELERKFRHFEKYDLKFFTWADLIVRVYGDNGKAMICFYIALLYRHIIYKANNNWFPLLYHFGLPESGKSTAAHSLASMFGEVIPDGINLESGSTITGINRYMSSVQDGLIWLNEYKNTLPLHILGMLKAIADGNGKLTGRATSGNQTKSYKPKSGAIVCGQDLPTKDPALLSRCIINEFSSNNRGDKDAYQILKEYEKQGFTTAVTCELLNYREPMLQYRAIEPVMTKELREICQKEYDIKPSDRAMLNACSLLVPVKILMETCGVQFPFSFDDARKIILDKVKLQTDIQAVSDDCEQYFAVIISLIGFRVMEGEHYKIQKEKDGITKLFLRIKTIHPFFAEAAPKQGVTPHQIGSIRSYLMKHRSFLEDRLKNVRFEKLSNPTSAMIFNYDMLLSQGIEFRTSQILKEMKPEDDPSRTIHLNGNAQELVSSFVQNLPAGGKYKMTELLEEFNSNKEPKLTKEIFVQHMMEYRKEGERDRDFDFDSHSFNEVKIRSYPF